MWKLQPTSETLKHHHHPLFNFSSEKGSLGMGERRPLQSSDCVSAAQTYASSRWCPTPEQLRALEEFYKRGIRTPSTYQIQQITAQLRRFGKIEGKNVFYWFQNHKARERQRIRRRLSMGSSVLLSDHSSKQMQDHVIKSFQGKSSKDLQVVHNKSWPINAALQEGVSKGRTDTAEGERDGWIQLFLDREIKQFSSSSVEHNNNGISPSRHSHVAHLLTSHISTTTRSNEDHNSCINWQIEPPKIGQQIPNKTLELFPLHGDEKAKEDPVQFYEFL